MAKRNYTIDFSIYSFKADDDFGDYQNGEFRKGTINKDGYYQHQYWCTDKKWHRMDEHIAKWEFFNGKINEGLQVDHIIPVRNGGTNKLSNLRLLTQKQNNNNPLTLINKKNAKKKEKHHFWGKHLSDKHRKKLSEANKGENNPMFGKNRPIGAGVQAKQVYQYTLDNELVKIWPSATSCNTIGGFSQGNVSACCRGERKTYKGYKWSYKPL